MTASLDKASYVPGDVATLTIKATDSKGAVVADTTVTGTGYAVAGSNMTAVTAPSTADTFTWGTKTYKFVVGSTEGSYQMTVSAPAYAATGVADITVPYTIKASTATVSNADVLKSIVSLIASINKQIQALQKLILRR
jgi:flagellar basal body rod protein FlgG